MRKMDSSTTQPSGKNAMGKVIKLHGRERGRKSSASSARATALHTSSSLLTSICFAFAILWQLLPVILLVYLSYVGTR
jgi:hypothetical protein